MPLQISSISANFKTRASSPYLVFEAECEGLRGERVRAQTKATKNATSWDEIIILPGHFLDGCELVVAAYNHNAILADDLIGSGGTDLTGLQGAGASSHLRRIQLFDKDDSPAGTLMMDVASVDKEAGGGGAPAVGAPVAAGAGAGAAAGGGGVSSAAAAAPTTPGAEGEVRRSPAGPSAAEAERERAEHKAQREREMGTAGAGGAAAPEGEGFIEKIKRATGVGSGAHAASAETAPVSAAPPVSTTTTTRKVPEPRHRELEGERRAAAAAPSSEAGGGAGKLSQFGRVIEGPEGGQVVERKVLTRVGERVAEIERVQRVTTRTPVESNFVVEVRLLSQRELPHEARREEGNVTERVIRVQEPEAPDAVAPSLKFEGEAKGMRQKAAHSEVATGGGTGIGRGIGGGGGMTSSSSSAGGGGLGGGGGSSSATMTERFREGQARGGTGEGLMEAADLRGGTTGSSATTSGMGSGAGGAGGGKLSSPREEEGRGLLGSTRAEA